MAHATTRRHLTAKTLTAGVVAGITIPVGMLASPAGAQINPGYQNTVRYTVQQDANWETMSNLLMTDALMVPGYGWRAGFRIRVGARWDSGLYYGAPWGNVEARAHLWVDTPHGPATMRTEPTLISVDVVPAFNGQWLAGCHGHTEGWNQLDPVARTGSWACSAPTVAGPNTNYQMGAYSVCVVARGLAFRDQPSSWFTAVGCPHPAHRI